MKLKLWSFQVFIISLILIGSIERSISPSAYEYSVNVWIYTYKTFFDIMLFWVPLTGNYYVDGSLQEKTPMCWSFLSIDPNTVLSIIFTWEITSTVHKFSKQTSITYGGRAGWQYFSFRYNAENPSGFDPSSTDLSMSVWDENGNVVSGYLTDTPSAANQLISNSFTFFNIDKLGYDNHFLVGLVYKIQFYNTLNDGNPESTRDSFIAQKMNDYFLYFNLENSQQMDYNGNSIRR